MKKIKVILKDLNIGDVFWWGGKKFKVNSKFYYDEEWGLIRCWVGTSFCLAFIDKNARVDVLPPAAEVDLNWKKGEVS